MNLADELRAIAAAQAAAEAALDLASEIETPLFRARLRVLVAQALIGAAGFNLGRAADGAATAALDAAFAAADAANWALIEALAAAQREEPDGR